MSFQNQTLPTYQLNSFLKHLATPEVKTAFVLDDVDTDGNPTGVPIDVSVDEFGRLRDAESAQKFEVQYKIMVDKLIRLISITSKTIVTDEFLQQIRDEIVAIVGDESTDGLICFKGSIGHKAVPNRINHVVFAFVASFNTLVDSFRTTAVDAILLGSEFNGTFSSEEFLLDGDAEMGSGQDWYGVEPSHLALTGVYDVSRIITTVGLDEVSRVKANDFAFKIEAASLGEVDGVARPSTTGLTNASYTAENTAAQTGQGYGLTIDFDIVGGEVDQSTIVVVDAGQGYDVGDSFTIPAVNGIGDFTVTSINLLGGIGNYIISDYVGNENSVAGATSPGIEAEANHRMALDVNGRGQVLDAGAQVGGCNDLHNLVRNRNLNDGQLPTTIEGNIYPESFAPEELRTLAASIELSAIKYLTVLPEGGMRIHHPVLKVEIQPIVNTMSEVSVAVVHLDVIQMYRSMVRRMNDVFAQVGTSVVRPAPTDPDVFQPIDSL